MQSPQFWSDILARELLSSLREEDLVDLLRHAEDQPEATVPTNHDMRSMIAEASRRDADLQLEIMRTWRRAHAEVVDSLRLIPIDGPAERCDAILRQFTPQDVLLELITDQDGGGWELAKWVVGNVKPETVRRDLATILGSWSKENDKSAAPTASASPAVRVVIFGGHVRDKNKMNERLFNRSQFEVRWKPFEKGAEIATLKSIYEAMNDADAVLIVTTMVSHNIMQMVKRVARENEVPFRVIAKATDVHLNTALGELFPAVSESLPPHRK